MLNLFLNLNPSSEHVTFQAAICKTQNLRIPEKKLIFFLPSINLPWVSTQNWAQSVQLCCL